MERKIGEQFEYNGVRLKVVKAKDHYCTGCYFYDEATGCRCIELVETIGYCTAINREDKKYVNFKEVKK